MEFIISNEITLLEALETIAPDSSKATLRSWLKNGRVFVDGQPEKIGNKLLNRGQIVTVGAKERLIEDKLRLIYEDQHFIVIEKPEGLLSVSTEREFYHTAHAILKRRVSPKKVHVIHRLDQGTSGVMVFAYSEEAYTGLKKLFQTHDIERRYVGIIQGHLKEKAGTWRTFLHEDDNYYVHSSDNPHHGVEAITHYTVKGVSKNCSLLDFKLETGKKNQIRVQCQTANCPILGDTKYGGNPHPNKRLCLHAYHLSFIHPITKKLMKFDAAIPTMFSKIVKH